MNDSGHSYGYPSVSAYLLLESILSAVCLVSHHDDVLSVRKRFVRLLELLHGREDDAVSLSVLEQFLQMFAAACLLRTLSEEVLTF